jgi:hypothetical protein
MTKKKMSCEERERAYLKNKGEKYKKYAEKYKKAQISDCEKKASPQVRKASEKIVGIKKQIAPLMNSIAEACAKGDKETVSELERKKCAMEKQLCIAEKEKHFSYMAGDIEKALKDYPASSELKKLERKFKENSDKYLSMLKEKYKLENECSSLDDSFGRLYKKMKIIKYRAKLKKMEKELNE